MADFFILVGFFCHNTEVRYCLHFLGRSGGLLLLARSNSHKIFGAFLQTL